MEHHSYLKCIISQLFIVFLSDYVVMSLCILVQALLHYTMFSYHDIKVVMALHVDIKKLYLFYLFIESLSRDHTIYKLYKKSFREFSLRYM